jgi:hypothetical protein
MWTILGEGENLFFLLLQFSHHEVWMFNMVFLMMTMKLKSTQAMVEVVAFTTNIVNLVIINPLIHLW